MKITTALIQHVAHLARLSITAAEEQQLQSAFIQTLKVIDNLQEVDLKNTEPTFQVTGLTNILREDAVDEKKMFNQTQALANAKKTHQGYFLVPLILKKE